ncbi:MAG TPA: hypothetical protein VMF06_19910 [Candidatus Limnocylindria bacterium]|jgi:protein involved in polysaccharide export with SLBB domain|nr:hypothetical protein [Candidatus Limnocylindria bacterium]
MQCRLTIAICFVFLTLGTFGAAVESNAVPGSVTNSLIDGSHRSETNKSNSRLIDMETRELKAGDNFRYWVSEDPANQRNPAEMRVQVTPTGMLLCPVSAIFPNYVTINCANLKVAEVRMAIKKALEESYYYTATVHLDLDSVPQGVEASASTAYAIFRNTVTGKVPLPEGKKTMLSEALISLHPPDYAELRKVKVSRKGINNTKGEIIKVDVKAILETNQRDKDVELKDGDIVEVPEKTFSF